MGIWISILYPEAIRNKGLRNDYKVKAVFSPLVKATLMLVICVLYKVGYPVLCNLSILESYKPILRKISYLLILEISLQMLLSIVSVLIPANFLKGDIDEKKAVDSQRQRLFRGRSEVDPSQ
jgi:hypothetical protein